MSSELVHEGGKGAQGARGQGEGVVIAPEPPRPLAPADGIPLVLDDDLTSAETDRRFAASQWRLMARRFRRNRAALVGGAVVLLFYLIALFAQFLAPYTLEQRFDEYLYLSPQPIKMFHD